MRPMIVFAALVATMALNAPAVAQQQRISGTGQACLGGAAGPVKCDYQTVEQCQQARPQGSRDQCVLRSSVEGTVGGPGNREPDRGTGAPGDQRD